VERLEPDSGLFSDFNDCEAKEVKFIGTRAMSGLLIDRMAIGVGGVGGEIADGHILAEDVRARRSKGVPQKIQDTGHLARPLYIATSGSI
jgi:hypothetical protein